LVFLTRKGNQDIAVKQGANDCAAREGAGIEWNEPKTNISGRWSF